MARRIFFSFYYDGDIRRVVQVRNSWVVRGEKETQPFLDKAEWEKIKRTGSTAVENWIESQLKGTSVTVVLIGARTYDRKWVRYEIKRSYQLRKGMLGIYINKIKDPILGVDARGKNPFDYWHMENNGRKTDFSEIYPTYDWVDDNGYRNIASWIEEAARNAGR